MNPLTITPEVVREPDTPASFKQAIKEEWDAEKFINEMYEQCLQAVDQGEYPPSTTFEKYLRDALTTVRENLVQARELYESQKDSILTINPMTLQEYNMAKEVAEMTEEAIRKFLERPRNMRLVAIA